MKKITLFFLLMVSSTFAKNLLIENETPYPNGAQKIAIQWAVSSKEVNEQNEALMQGGELNPGRMQALIHQGKVKLSLPKAAEYFRVVVWPSGQRTPELLTNWIEIAPDRTYQLKTDHLIPAVLMCGMGC